MSKTYNVLFICSGNSARSIMGESIMNFHSKGEFKAHSAGFQPRGEIMPQTLFLLRQLSMPTDHLRSKHVSEFTAPDAPKMDFVFTVCEIAAKEATPDWPGRPMLANWAIPNPALVQGTEAEMMQAYRDAFAMMERRIRAFISLPVGALDKLAMQREVDVIGMMRH